MDLHSLFAHFPIALILTGALFDAIGILTQRDWALRAGHLLLALGALGAIVSALTGDTAAQMASRIEHIQSDLDYHEELGTIAAWLSIALTLLRTHFVFKNQFTTSLRYTYLILIFATAVLIAFTGHSGGQLVYQYGAGTNPILKTLKNQP